jgi:hypothetical protein
MRLITSQITRLLIFSTLLPLTYASAEMTSLSDNDLSEVDGAGIGLVMDDFVFSHGNDAANGKVFKISGLNDSDGSPVSINVNQLYIARSGSNYGTTLDPVNLGRLSNPFEINLLDGNDVGIDDKAVLQFAAPTKVDVAGTGFSCINPALGEGSGDCSSRPAYTATSEGVWENGERPDMGLELEIATATSGPKNLNFNVKSAVFDGSYVRLWGDDNQKMAAEFRLNFYTPELEISTCAQLNQACGSSVKMQDFQLELALGTTFQPLYIGADNITGGLTLEIAKITHEYIDNLSAGASDGTANGDAAEAFFTDYYTNDSYRSNIVIGNLDVSGTSLGSAKVEGMLIQYLDVKFRDLDLVP